MRQAAPSCSEVALPGGCCAAAAGALLPMDAGIMGSGQQKKGFDMWGKLACWQRRCAAKAWAGQG